MNIILSEYDGQKVWSAVGVEKEISIAGLVRGGFINVALVGSLIIQRLEPFFTRHIFRYSAGFLPSFSLRQTSGVSLLFHLSKQIGVAYNTAWAMLQRMRYAMAKRDAQYKLAGSVELDEMYIGASTEGKKRGRGTEKTPVLVAVSSVFGKKGKKYMGFAKMRAVKKIDAETIVKFAKSTIEHGSRVRSDGLSVYPALDNHGFLHEPHAIKKRKAHVVLPHVHIYISNLRSFVIGTYHGLGELHLQQYLDEFCYRFNRRRHYHELFDRLLLACLEKEEMPFSALTE